MKASPICLTTRPSQRLTTSRTNCEKRARTSAAAASPIASVSGVKLERSTNRTAARSCAGAEGVGLSACQLEQGLLRNPRLEHDLQRLQRLHVLLIEPLALPAEAQRLPQSPDRRGVQSYDADRLLHGVRPP